MNGFINLNKAEGMSSASAVNKIKYTFKVKCGHMGTLDPLALGVLPVGIGKAARLFSYLLDKDKQYTARFKFGEITDTLDRGGKITLSGMPIPTMQDIEAALDSLTGEVMQVPPVFSAKHVGGVRSYVLAREGKAQELPAKKVRIDSLKLTDKISDSEYEFSIGCGGGTYIRAIARDLAVRLNTCAYMTYLQRTKSGVFSIENTVTLQELADNGMERYLLPTDSCIDFEKLFLDEKQAFKALNGVPLNSEKQDGLYRLYDQSFIGIGEVRGGFLRIKTFLR